MNLHVIRRATVAVAAAAAAAVPFAAAPQAQAQTPVEQAASIGVVGALPQAVSSYGCTVVPLKPVAAGVRMAGKKVVRYDYQISCLGNRQVVMQQLVREDDFLFDRTIDTNVQAYTFNVANTFTAQFWGLLPNTEFGNEEMYHQIRFQVTVDGRTSPLTGWHRSPVESIAN